MTWRGGRRLLRNALQHETADHVPVLAEEVRELLAVQPGETVIDGTFGAGGHAELLAADLGGKGRFIAVDRDASVRPYFERFQRRANVQARFLRGDFAVVLGQLADNDVTADAILLDLGVSSMQIDRPERGFSYAADAPLDMRMDVTGSPVGAGHRQRVERARARGDLPPLRRRTVLAADRAGDRAPPRARAPSSGRPTSSRSSAPRSRRRAASETGIRPSAYSRRSGSSSTRSSSRWRRLCPSHSGC